MTNHIDIIRDILKVFWHTLFVHRIIQFFDLADDHTRVYRGGEDAA